MFPTEVMEDGALAAAFFSVGATLGCIVGWAIGRLWPGPKDYKDAERL